MHGLVLVALLATVTAAPQASDGGVQLAVRGAFNVPAGSIDSRTNFNDGFAGFAPFGLEAGYRFDRHLYLGLFGEYGFGFVKNCAAGLDCSAHTWALGLNGRYHFTVSPRLRTWLGFNAGYEWFTGDVSAPANNTASVSAHGLRYFGGEMGLDLFVAPMVAVGPYFSGSVGEYSSESQTVNGTNATPSFEKAMHAFFQFGLRVSFVP
jgi:hypothetical protein